MIHPEKGSKPYSPTYLRTLNNQLSAIFNHAERYYDLQNNPCGKVAKIGSKKGKEMQFWTKDEYLKFSDAIMDKPLSFYIFEILYWTGMRVGHESTDITYRYAHLFPNKQSEIANALNGTKGGD